MICETCKSEGKTSRVFDRGGTTTCAYYQPFYDEQGQYHHHDGNVTVSCCECSNGHRWTIESTGSCWCGWPNEKETAPAVNPTSPTKTRRFTVYRRGDLSETHNANQVNPADQPQYEGVVFSDGTTVVRWLTAARSTSVWADFDTLWKIHGHDDANSKHGTVIVWHDDAATTKEKP